jgi:hypothetical protein
VPEEGEIKETIMVASERASDFNRGNEKKESKVNDTTVDFVVIASPAFPAEQGW